MALVTGGTSGSGSSVGGSVLIYRLTVTGADKASIDTGVDAPDAGANDWTGGDVLEVFLYSRTDEAVVSSGFDVVLNNDSSALYDRQYISGINITASVGTSLAQTKWAFTTYGASATASTFGTWGLVMPAYAGTVGKKTAQSRTDRVETTAANSEILLTSLTYRSASAITRLKVLPTTAAKKLVVGSMLVIYKRVS